MDQDSRQGHFYGTATLRWNVCKRTALMSPKPRRRIGLSAAMIVIKLFCCLATRCGGKQQTTLPTTPSRAYRTTFPLTEKPISEGSNWTNAFPAVNNQIETLPGFAFGQGSIPNDPIAILTGSWGPNQTAQATVKINSTPAGCCHELGLHPRMSPSSASYTGTRLFSARFGRPLMFRSCVGTTTANGPISTTATQRITL